MFHVLTTEQPNKVTDHSYLHILLISSEPFNIQFNIHVSDTAAAIHQTPAGKKKKNIHTLLLICKCSRKALCLQNNNISVNLTQTLE